MFFNINSNEGRLAFTYNKIMISQKKKRKKDKGNLLLKKIERKRN